MQSPVNPNPVGAMLDIVRVSFPAANARSFTCPDAWSACSQKKRKAVFSISSSSWSSVPGKLSAVGGGEGEELPLPQPNGKVATLGSEEITAILQSCARSWRLVKSFFTMPFPRFDAEENHPQVERLARDQPCPF